MARLMWLSSTISAHSPEMSAVLLNFGWLPGGCF
jgi:hypothetical protein